VNRDQVLSHLSEARDAIASAIEEIRLAPGYDDAEFWIDMQHIYHHINTAWNSRHTTAAEVERANDRDFNRWNKLPADLPMMELGREP
jgi:hypothetical protein